MKLYYKIAFRQEKKKKKTVPGGRSFPEHSTCLRQNCESVQWQYNSLFNDKNVILRKCNLTLVWILAPVYLGVALVNTAPLRPFVLPRPATGADRFNVNITEDDKLRKTNKNWPYFLKQEPWFSSSLVSPLPLLQAADIPPAASGSRTVWSQWQCLRSGWKRWAKRIKWQFSALL